MARFPRTEAEVLALAESMITGLTANAVLYPAPPESKRNVGTLRLVPSGASRNPKFECLNPKQIQISNDRKLKREAYILGG